MISKPTIKAQRREKKNNGGGCAEKHIYILHKGDFFFLACRDLVVILRKSLVFESYSHLSFFLIKVPAEVIWM